MTKRILAALLVLCMMVPVFVSASAEAPAWADIYRNFIINRSYLNTASPFVTYNEEGEMAVGFAVYDLNNDNVPELLIQDGGEADADRNVYLYTINGNEVVFVNVIGGQSGSDYRYSDNSRYTGLFYDYTNAARLYVTDYVTMKNGIVNFATVAKTNDAGTTTVVTEDKNLYQASVDAENVLTFFDIEDIEAMGWETFLEVDDFQEQIEEEEVKSAYTIFTDTNTKQYAVITGRSVNLRNIPTTEGSTVLKTAAKGNALYYLHQYAIDGEGCTWYYVQRAGVNCWVHSSLATLSNQPGSNTGSYVYVTGNSINVRSNPDVDSKSLGTAKKGESIAYRGVTFTDERGVVWYCVTYKKNVAWASSKYVSTTKPVAPTGKIIYITGDSVRVRVDPDKDSSSLGIVHQGDELTYKGSTSTDSRGVVWYCVQYKNKTGWVSSKYASVTKGGSGSKTVKTVTITGSVYVRSEPNKDSKRLGTVHKGDEYTYLNSTSTDSRGVDWYCITFNNKTAWVSSKYAKINK